MKKLYMLLALSFMLVGIKVHSENENAEVKKVGVERPVLTIVAPVHSGQLDHVISPSPKSPKKDKSHPITPYSAGGTRLKRCASAGGFPIDDAA